MAVLPGKPDSLLTGWADGYDYVVFNDDSAVRTHLAPIYGPASVAFTGPTTFAGLDTGSSGTPLYLEKVAADGSVSTEAEVTRNISIPFTPSDIAFGGGKLFLSDGETLNASSLSHAGQFPVDNPSGTVLADFAHNSVYLATGGPSGSPALEQFDPDTYTKKNQFPIPADGPSPTPLTALLVLQASPTLFVKVTSTDVVLFDIGNHAALAPLIESVGGLAGALSPGAEASIRGLRLSHYAAEAPAPEAWTNVAGVTVLVNAERAYLTSVTPGELQIILPADIPVGPTSFQVVVDQNLSPAFQATVVKAK
jgi:hypothetical protein